MISSFGLFMKKLRDKTGDSLRTCATKLSITAPFLSAMEVGKRPIPKNYLEKINNVYNLDNNDYIELSNAIIETNKRVDIETDKLNKDQKEVSMMFARKIENADHNLIEKLRKVLEEN